MNKLILIGRLTGAPEVRYGSNDKAVANFSLAVNRRFKRDGEPNADFFNCVAFGKNAEFAEKYLTKGMKIVIEGEIHNNDYTNKDGVKIHNMQVICSSFEFCESKSANGVPASNTASNPTSQPASNDGFVNVPDGLEDELPFN
jgi:single-strand DNA-binding protein